MPDLDITHALVAAVAALPGLVALWRRRVEHQADAYDDARKDLDGCRKRTAELERKVGELESSNVVLMNGIANLSREHDNLKRDCTARDLVAATERERDRKLMEAMRSEMDGLRRSITGDAR